MATRRAFLLNLDADLELAAEKRTYTPSVAVQRAMRAHVRTLATSLVPEGDVVITDDTPARALEGYVAHAFSPTPRALARIEQVGATPAITLPFDVLRSVARRDFGYIDELSSGRVHHDMERALADLRAHSDRARRLKRVYGMAGRGHRIVRGAPNADDEAFVRASSPALIVEPNVWITRELSLHGFLREGGEVVHGELCESVSDARGAWRTTCLIEPDAIDAATHARMHDALERAGRALGEAGYFGPFGIDGFEHVEGGMTALRTTSEINARYSMGWGIGFSRFGALRPDLTA